MVKSRVEYATDQITVYRFCPYACKYCYVWNVPLMRKRVQAGSYDPIEEAKKYLRIKKKKTIVVSFVSDPYPKEEITQLRTRKVLEILSKTKHRVMLLTKNPILALRDLDIMQKIPDFYFGTTIICLDNSKYKEYEPLAPKPRARVKALEIAKEEYGIKTWISIEPIIPFFTDPAYIIMDTRDFTDLYILGAFNYYKQLGFCFDKEKVRNWYNEIFKNNVRFEIAFSEIEGCKFILKKELINWFSEETKESLSIK